MNPGRAAAARIALCAALSLGGCAALRSPPPPAPSAMTADAAAAPSASASSAGVRVEIEAPEALKSLLEKHLDLVRLGRTARDEVDASEWSRLIEAAPAQVRDLLQTEGYFKARVRLQHAQAAPAGEPVGVRLSVDPGERARVVRFTLEAEGELERGAAAGDSHAVATLERLRSAWELQPGRDFRNPAWNDAKSATLARLRAAGYAAASWLGTGAEVDVESGGVRLFAVVDSGPLFRYGRLQVDGLVRQDRETVENLLAAREGSPVTESLLLDFQERLQKSGLFDTISVALDPDPAGAGQARIVATLRESPLQVYTFGVGVSANTGPRASVEHLYRRVFGFAASSRLKAEIGQKRQALDAEVTTHALKGLNRNLVGGAVERLQSDTDVVISQRLRIGRSQDTQRIDRLYFGEVERSVRQVPGAADTAALAVSANFHGGWRILDSLVLPTEGYAAALQYGAGRSSGTDAVAGVFTRAYGRVVGYLPIGKTWYGQARIEAGQVLLKPGMVVPESQKFRAGGDESVRGYSYRSLGPLVDGVVGSGNALATASVELARPLSASTPSLWGAVFADAGNAADELSKIRPALGTGLGLRWRSPVGPLRVDWAYGREVRSWRLHFSVGIAL